jgi:hypothetical protein
MQFVEQLFELLGTGGAGVTQVRGKSLDQLAFTPKRSFDYWM